MHHAGEAAAADERTLCPDTGPVLGRIRHHMGFFDGTAAVPGLFQQSDRRGIVSGADASYRGAAGAGGTGRPGRTFHQPAPGVGAGVSGGDRGGSDVGLGSQPPADGGAVCAHWRMPDGNAAIFQLHGYGVADGRGRPELRVGTRHRLGMLCGAGAAPGSADGAVRSDAGGSGVCGAVCDTGPGGVAIPVSAGSQNGRGEASGSYQPPAAAEISPVCAAACGMRTADGVPQLLMHLYDPHRGEGRGRVRSHGCGFGIGGVSGAAGYGTVQPDAAEAVSGMAAASVRRCVSGEDRSFLAGGVYDRHLSGIGAAIF